MAEKTKDFTVYVTDPCLYKGRHVDKGETLNNVEPEDAHSIVAAGRGHIKGPKGETPEGWEDMEAGFLARQESEAKAAKKPKAKKTADDTSDDTPPA